jgi:hypothetical protein
MPDPTNPPSLDAPIPTQTGLGLAAVVLGAICLPVSAYLGVQCLSISLPVFGLWFFLPVVVLAIVLGMLAARTPQGIAGAVLGVAALLTCLSFTLVERMYGPEIRAQIRSESAAPPSLKAEQLMKLMGNLPAGQKSHSP